MARKSLSELLNGKFVFGEYTVIGESRPSAKCRFALCRCSCGALKTVAVDKLRSGRSTRCKKCAAKSQSRITNRKHGLSSSREYSTWSNMLQRCNNPDAHNYAEYGGRGIKVCERWQNSFEAFYEDMGSKPEGSSIDRIDNDDGYSPHNCRWATGLEQQSNRRVTLKTDIGGEEVAISLLARKAGMSAATLAARLDRGWSLEYAMQTPVEDRCPTHSVNGVPMTASQIAKACGRQRQTVNRWLRLGKSPDWIIQHYE